MQNQTPAGRLECRDGGHLMTVLFAGDRIIPPDRKNSQTGKNRMGKSDWTGKTERKTRPDRDNQQDRERGEHNDQNHYERRRRH